VLKEKRPGMGPGLVREPELAHLREGHPETGKTSHVLTGQQAHG
jgi:hypothetical protein